MHGKELTNDEIRDAEELFELDDQNDEEEIEPVVLKPCMSIDVLEIVNGWMECC